jgi:hypothetical protein
MDDPRPAVAFAAKSEKEKPTAAVFKKGDSNRKHFHSIKSFG